MKTIFKYWIIIYVQQYFKTEITEDAFANFPYFKSKKDVLGMDKFFERAYWQHIKHRINFAILAFTVISSSEYYQKYVEPKQIIWYAEKEKVDIDKRLKLENH